MREVQVALSSLSDDDLYERARLGLGAAVTGGWVAADAIAELRHRGKTFGQIALRLGKDRTDVRRLSEIAGEFPPLSDARDLTVWSCWPLLVKAKRGAKTLAAQEAGLLPSAKYRVVYADPPWEYATPQHSKEEQVTTLEVHYQSMSIEDLCALDVPAFTDENAVLFMWATSPLLEQAFRVVNAWGFSYKASMIWDKVKHNVGHYVSVRHELVLISTKGSCLPDVPKLHDSVFSIERTKHSEKPEHVRSVIDEIYPHGKRIELFARRKAEGWDCWGNQLAGEGPERGEDSEAPLASA